MLKLLKIFKKKLPVVLLVGFLVVGSFGVGNSAQACSVWSGEFVECSLATLAQYFFGAVILALGTVLQLLTYVLTAVIKYDSFVSAGPVNLGWTLVRDVSNLFFVVVLLIIAIGTILQLDSYNIKKMLPKILLMAVLVNFSLLVAGVLIEAAQVVMLTFVAAFDGAIGSNLFKTLQITEIVSAQNNANYADNVGDIDFTAVLMNGILAVVFLSISLMVIGIMTIALVVRVVAIWILLVLAPLPYILYAFPFTKKYANMWWDEFIKYLVYGPSIAFFLWLAFATVNQANNIILPQGNALTPTGSNQTISPEGAFLSVADGQTFLTYLVGIAMLIGGLMVTQKLGGVAGGMAGSGLDKLRSIGSAPINLAKKIPGAAEKAFFGATGIGLSPARFKQGLSTRFNAWEKRMEDQGSGKGAARATALLTNKGVFGTRIAQRALGMAQLASASPEDFAHNYLGARGLWRAGRTLIKGTGKAEFEKFEQDKKARDRKIAAYKKFGDTGSADEKGREVLIEDTKNKMRADLLAGRAAITEKNATGGYSVKTINPADYDALVAGATKKDLEELGLDSKYSIDDKSKKGVKLESAQEEEKFKEDFLAAHATRMVNDVGKYQDKNTGLLASVDAAALERAGEEYYANEEARRSDEIVRIENRGGITDDQLKSRQSQLNHINEEMLKVLKQIEGQGNTATAEQVAELDRLKTKGSDLGGVAMVDSVTGQYHFGKAANDRVSQELTHTAIGSRTTEESEAIKLDELKESLGYFKEERKIATARPEVRAAEKERYRKEAQQLEESLSAQEKQLRAKYEQAPLAYNALANLRSAESDEIRKLPQEMEWSEIRSELDTAFKLKNVPKIRALIKKAAMDGNDNEVWNDFGYSSDAAGMRKFGEEELVKKLGMKEQEMLQFMSDVGYINEGVGHFETGRMVSVNRGVAEWATPEAHAAAVANENLKKDSRGFLQKTNRLGLGGEENGKYKISMSGKLTLAGLGDAELNYRLERGEFNPSALSKLAEDIEGLEDMVKRGWMSEKTKNAITRLAAKKSLKANYGDLLEKAKTLK